ncbi:hypothetical protein LSH36_19g04006 [Paralvinella palmiformis]|uniref:G-protein coupled receptors family 1 profile domain-containing protein n=1 Tax=Paralvinella palmiformis TaxID=53620 RepID=A0AAD9KBD5_9ANNE|nr:hypothetical protein LSH36_19g04006 [Paralvinella palmiformis]
MDPVTWPTSASSVLPTDNSTSFPDIYTRYSWPELLMLHRPAAILVDRSLTPIFYAIGITGNSLSAKIWLERPMRRNNSSAVYLATLSITDLFFLLLHIILELNYAWGIQTLDYPGLCEGYFLVYFVATYLSPILVLAFTIERYIAVCHPFQKERFCTTRRAFKVVVVLVTFSVLLSCIQAYLWSYDAATGRCEIRREVVRGGEYSLWSIWTWVSEILSFFVVPFLILVFNVLVLREVRRLSQAGCTMLPGQTGSGSAATTAMLLSVSFYVILTTIPASVVYSLQIQDGDPYLSDEQIRNDPVWQRYFDFLTVRKVVEEICLSHYACNIVLYMITGTQFRKAFAETFSNFRCGEKAGDYSEVNNHRPNNSVTYQTKV